MHTFAPTTDENGISTACGPADHQKVAPVRSYSDERITVNTGPILGLGPLRSHRAGVVGLGAFDLEKIGICSSRI